jgi:hypothetical protein
VAKQFKSGHWLQRLVLFNVLVAIVFPAYAFSQSQDLYHLRPDANTFPFNFSIDIDQFITETPAGGSAPATCRGQVHHNYFLRRQLML